MAIGIATIGRAAILRETLVEVRAQSRPCDRLIICATQPSDVEGTITESPDEHMVFTKPGLPRQRNKILEMAADCDIVLFIDDDFLLDRDYLAATLAAFEVDPALVVTTGTVLADGITGAGLSAAEGRRILAEDSGRPHPEMNPVPSFAGYGCNMAIRMAVAQREGIRVDERLPLYAWQEDVDFTRQLAQHGTVARLPTARGVHLGTKTGRGSGRRLGYSQVANPIYLMRKARRDAYPAAYAARRVLGNLAANLLHALRPEPHVDRRGRLRGNLVALGDLLRGRLAPERALDL
ncbi:glycosyltransferase family 2 protein [Plastoroseomonas arctica]|uniref:Glycosyltransferase family 2 protein n=1 Tax=Plastoroseomonas arctica TaxID=1509237 RepID=A0AAF1K1K6_9PROT|nr:glycosyltransferase [Plastoroseomonas arctica]MBR0657398.1 glycosyltransferase family 2 protein [Plastoroseomonas arctica]